MIHLFYSEDRDVCTYPKGYRFEWSKLLQDESGQFWIEGKGFLGCVTKLQITQSEAMEWLKKRNTGLNFEVN